MSHADFGSYAFRTCAARTAAVAPIRPFLGALWEVVRPVDLAVQVCNRCRDLNLSSGLGKAHFVLPTHVLSGHQRDPAVEGGVGKREGGLLAVAGSSHVN